MIFCSVVYHENLPKYQSDLLYFVFLVMQELKASGKVWVLMNSDSQEDIVYPNDPKIVIKVCPTNVFESFIQCFTTLSDSCQCFTIDITLMGVLEMSCGRWMMI
jgi:hypothetical protein